MSKKRFRSLEIEMLRRGVALRHARRAALELECHHRELVEQALGRGEIPEHAEQSAHETLGADAVIVERYASQKELQSWAYRWRAGYLLAPLLGFACLFVAVLTALIALSTHLSAPLHHMRIPPGVSHDLDALVSVLLLWVCPTLVAFGFGALAGRHRIGLRWLMAGIVVLCIGAALTNVRFVLTGGSPAGVIGAGIGFSTSGLPREILRSLSMATVAVIPAAWLRHWVMSRLSAPE
jgi:hypothetical protein